MSDGRHAMTWQEWRQSQADMAGAASWDDLMAAALEQGATKADEHDRFAALFRRPTDQPRRD